MGMKKSGPLAKVFSQTLAHGNGKNERQSRKEEEHKQKRVNVERSKAGAK